MNPVAQKSGTTMFIVRCVHNGAAWGTFKDELGATIRRDKLKSEYPMLRFSIVKRTILDQTIA